MLIDEKYEAMVEVLPVDSLDEVLQHALVGAEEKVTLVEISQCNRYNLERSRHPTIYLILRFSPSSFDANSRSVFTPLVGDWMAAPAVVVHGGAGAGLRDYPICNPN